jgi:general secretion pathway protein D
MNLRNSRRRLGLMSFAILLTLSSAGCVISRAYREAKEEESLGHWDMAVLKYAEALDADPTNNRLRMALLNSKQRASQAHFDRGRVYRSSGHADLAVVELQQTVALDPTNHYAETELAKAKEEAARAAAERDGESKMQASKRRTRGARPRAPMLEPASDRPINLNFPQPKPIKQIYMSLAQAAGINVIFDPQLKDENVSIVLTNISFQTALETLMRQENHFYKVIDEKTMLIAADTPQNRKTYEDLVIRTFFLSNGDVTDVSNALRQLLQTTRISINKAENSITLRDTADKVAIAEKIIEQNDKQLAEVVIDVELVQVNTSRMTDIGLLLSGYSVGASIPAPGGTTDNGATLPDGTFSWDQLKALSIRSFGFNIPSATYNFIKNNSEAELLAKPQLRISEGQKAQLVIGDKVPIPTTSFNTSNTVGGAIVPVTSFQYQDVGIKIEVEPRVHHNKEVTLKLVLEVSQLGEVVKYSGTEQPTIGTRTISSNIRLKDGETNFLAGLFRTDKTRTDTTIPFIGDIPILGRLFTDKAKTNKTTDLVLTLTPHIIRIPDVTDEDLMPVYVGTDANISFRGGPQIETPGGAPGPFDTPRGTPPARPGGPATAPPPTNLAPVAPPSDPFRSPRESVPPQPPNTGYRPPQGTSSDSSLGTDATTPVAGSGTGTLATTSKSAVTAVSAQGGLLFDVAPASVALSSGQQRSLLVRVSGEDGSADPSIVLRFDPSVVTVVSVRSILTDGAVVDSRVEPGRVVIQSLSPVPVSGTKAIAEIVLQGVKPGSTALTFERGTSAAGFADASVEVH